MNVRSLVLFIFFVKLFLVTNCGITKNDRAPFDVKEVYYQSRINNKEEISTDIMIHLNKVRQGVQFDSLIFRGIRLPVFAIEENSVVVLKGLLSTGIAKLPVETEYVGKPDQLIYTFKGSKRSVLLKNIQRREMKYKN